MVTVGHHLYIEQTGDQGGNALYRWTPAYSSQSPPSGAPAPAPAPAVAPAGTTAGIVIAILVALANTTLLVLLALKVRVDCLIQVSLSEIVSGSTTGRCTALRRRRAQGC